MAFFRRLTSMFALLLLTAGTLPAAASAAAAPTVQVLAPITAGVTAPLRLAEDRAGNFYLTDPKAGGVLKFDRYGVLQKLFPLKNVQGIAISDAGDLIVGQGDAVSVLDSSGNLRFRLGKGGGQFRFADGITVDAAGYIYVVDSLDDCVQVFNPAGAAINIGSAAAGKPANSFGSGGSGSRQLSMPTGIAYEKVSGQLAVADTLNGRVQFFDTAGAWKRAIGGAGAGPLRFAFPVGVTFEYSAGSSPALERMYLADSFQSSVQVIDPAEPPVWLGFIGGYGRANGKLLTPADALIDPVGGRLLVANGFGTIAVYGLNGGGLPTDRTPPALTIAPVPQVTSSPTVTIHGTVEAGALLTAATNSSAVAGTAVMGSPTDWTVAVTGLVPGVNVITITATDTAGNAAVQTVAITYSAAAVNLTVNRVTTPTNSRSQTISGTMDSGAAVSAAAGSAAVIGPVTYPTPTTWSFTVSGLVAGDNLLTISAGKAGRDTAVTRAVITLNTTPPPLSLAMLADGAVVSSPVLTVTGLTDAAILSVMINGEAVATDKGMFSKGLLLAMGTNSIAVTATDAAGNVSTLSRSITFEPLAPVVSITSPTGGAVTNQNIIQITGRSPAGSSTAIKVNGGVQTVVSTPDWTATVSLANGPGLYTLEAVTTVANRIAAAAVTVSLVDLTTPPLALASPPADLITNSSSLAVAGTAAGGTVTATLNGAALPVSRDPLTGSYTLQAGFTAEGEYRLAVTETDAFGSSSTVVRTLLYDITPPVLAVTSQSANLLTGTGEPGTVVTVRDGTGQPVGTAAVTGSGSWSLALGGTESGPLNIYALDAAGNSSRNGDLNGSGGAADIADALKAARITVGLDTSPPLNAPELLRGDVAPVVNGVSVPDGKIDIDDVMIILMKAVGALK